MDTTPPAPRVADMPPAGTPAIASSTETLPGGSSQSGIKPSGITIDIAGILRSIPHRYPFLMIDRVIDVVLGESGTGIKNVTVNDNFFQGHFPEHPVMPGVLIIEAMAQTSAVLVVQTLGDDAAGKLVYFMSIDNAKFRKPVVPGDQLRIHCRKERSRGNVWRFNAVARVDGVAVAEATFSAMIMTDPKKADPDKAGPNKADPNKAGPAGA